MKDKKLAIVIAAIAIFTGGGYLLSNPNFQEKPESTIKGASTVTYTPGQFYTELDEKIKAFYDYTNATGVAGKNGTEILEESKKALSLVNDIDTFVNEIDEFKRAEGIEDLKGTINRWMGINRNVYENRYKELASIVGEDGKVNTQADFEKANSLINLFGDEQREVLEELNNAIEVFYSINDL